MSPQTYPPEEDAFPKGHPARPDYDPDSPEAKAWHKKQRALEHTEGLPPNYTFDPTRPHGGLNWQDGVDPLRPDLEPFTGLPRRPKPAVENPAKAEAKPGKPGQPSAKPGTIPPAPAAPESSPSTAPAASPETPAETPSQSSPATPGSGVQGS